jgi:hypothetical protein
MNRSIDKNTQKQILDLFLNSDDNRLKSIGKVVNFSTVPVMNVIDKYFNGLIYYNKPDYKIYHSKMNYESRV